jgi:hypothetical protein
MKNHIKHTIKNLIIKVLKNYDPKISLDIFVSIIYDRLCNNLSYTELNSKYKIPLSSLFNYIHKYLNIYDEIITTTLTSKLKEFRGKEVIIDSTCIKTYRRKDNVYYYCSNHKHYSVKVTTLTDIKGNVLFYLPTFSSLHDVKVGRYIINYCNSLGITVIGDKGYISKEFTNTITPFKGVRVLKNTFNKTYKEIILFNKIISRIRFVIERTFGWIKNRFHITSYLRCYMKNINKYINNIFYLQSIL